MKKRIKWASELNLYLAQAKQKHEGGCVQKEQMALGRWQGEPAQAIHNFCFRVSVFYSFWELRVTVDNGALLRLRSSSSSRSNHVSDASVHGHQAPSLPPPLHGLLKRWFTRFDFCLLGFQVSVLHVLLCSDSLIMVMFCMRCEKKKKKEILPLAFGDGGGRWLGGAWGGWRWGVVMLACSCWKAWYSVFFIFRFNDDIWKPLHILFLNTSFPCFCMLVCLIWIWMWIYEPYDEVALRVACWFECFDFDVGLNKGYGF